MVMHKDKDKKEKLLKNAETIVRSFGISDFRAQDEDKTVDGHAAVFNQRTNIGNWFYEVIERGAFDNCDFDDVLFFVNHDTRKIPMARSRRNNGNSTMQLSIDDKGLYTKAMLDTENNSEASSLYSSIKRGDIDGMSFMFCVEEERWTDLDTDMPTRYVTKIKKVYEVSAVNMPAYQGTDITARDQQALENAKKTLENVRSEELENSDAAVGIEIEKYKAQLLMKG